MAFSLLCERDATPSLGRDATRGARAPKNYIAERADHDAIAARNLKTENPLTPRHDRGVPQ
jgi:hypothetical protein